MKAAAWSVLLLALANAVMADEPSEARQWEPFEIRFAADGAHPWWVFPVQADFLHSSTGERVRLTAYWDGGNEWAIRFAPPRPGVWTWEQRLRRGRTRH